MINYNDYSLIPDHMMLNMTGYVEGTEFLGGFLYAVFCNDLFKAIGQADDESLVLLPVYVRYIYNKLPMGCHGSPEIVEAWTKKKEQERRQDERRNRE